MYRNEENKKRHKKSVVHEVNEKESTTDQCLLYLCNNYKNNNE